jgi:hypothetical protein
MIDEEEGAGLLHATRFLARDGAIRLLPGGILVVVEDGDNRKR